MTVADDRLPYANATALARAIASRRISPVEVVETTLRRIERLNPTLNAFIAIREQAMDDARAAERAVVRRQTKPLLGVPISIKDLILTRDLPTTAGSRIFGTGLTSEHDAPVVARLKRAGAIIIGKNNLHEIALGVTNLNAHFGPARNPWDTTRVPGGSSGGSAVAVAAGLGMASVGSDTRGSIRIPASCCGVTGLKATYGLVSTDDVIPLSWSLDHVGPITRTVEDAALLLGAMTGSARYVRVARRVKGMTIGICEYFMRDLDAEVGRAVNEAVRVLKELGAKIERVSIPELEPSHGASAAITVAEAVAYHDRALKERPEGFSPAVRGRLETGYALTALELVRAQRQRQDVVTGFARAFTQVDCLVGATLPMTAATIGEDALRFGGRDTTVLAEYPRLTSPGNLAGIPSLTVPCGFTKAGLPIGLQIMAEQKKETTVLAVGAAYQRETSWHESLPPV